MNRREGTAREKKGQQHISIIGGWEGDTADMLKQSAQMPFKSACFLSYRHAQFPLMRNFVVQFHEAFASELEPLTDLPVYQDFERLQGGDSFDQQLSRNLCE